MNYHLHVMIAVVNLLQTKKKIWNIVKFICLILHHVHVAVKNFMYGIFKQKD